MNSDWRKSSYSSSTGGNCVEVATGNAVLVRDTTNRAGVTLSLPVSAWSVFVSELRATVLPPAESTREGPVTSTGPFCRYGAGTPSR